MGREGTGVGLAVGIPVGGFVADGTGACVGATLRTSVGIGDGAGDGADDDPADAAISAARVSAARDGRTPFATGVGGTEAGSPARRLWLLPFPCSHVPPLDWLQPMWSFRKFLSEGCGCDFE